MKRMEWMWVGVMSAALLLGAGCRTAQTHTPVEPQPSQAAGGSGASERSDPGSVAGQPGQQTATYEVPSLQPGEPSLRLALVFAPEGKTVSGTGSLREATAPPLVLTELQGDVGPADPTGHAGHEGRLVVATGHPPFKLPPHSGHGPVVPENFELRLWISPDGQTGQASYKYRPEQGAAWIDVKTAPAHRVDTP